MEIASIILLVVLIDLVIFLIFRKSGPVSNEGLATKADLFEKQVHELKSEKDALQNQVSKLNSDLGTKDGKISELNSKLDLQARILDQKLNEREEAVKQQLELVKQREVETLRIHLKDLENRLQSSETDWKAKLDLAIETERNLASKSLGDQKTEAAQKYGQLEADLAKHKSNLDASNQQLAQKDVAIQELKDRHKADLDDQNKLRKEVTEQVNEMKKQLTDTFAKVSQEAIEQSSVSFLSKASQNLEQVLLPVKEFKEKVESQIKQGTENKVSFEEQIKELKESTRKIQLDAQNLTEALRGNKKIQGNWGEVQLTSLLDKSGLREGINYNKQVSGKTEDGKSQIFDVQVLLPGDKQIIIDAKVSLINYVDALNANTEEEANKLLIAYVGNLKDHIKGLSDKNYHKAVGLNTVEYVMLFVPIETAFIAACTQDPSLWEFAYDRKIVMVTPSTLLATLLAIHSIWQKEGRNRNAEEIANLAGGIYDKMVTFIQSFEKIEKHLKSASDSYDHARKVLVDGKGNAINRLESLKKLGVSPTKKLSDTSFGNNFSDDAEEVEIINQI